MNSPGRSNCTRALAGALFICGFSACAAATPACEPDRIDARAAVVSVHDGDTVWLKDLGALRLIGLDTPELGRDGEPAQPYARQAAETLEALLAEHGHRVELRFGAERRDDYGRLLAHLYLPDKNSVTAHLLRRGLATALTVPPNDWNLDCYQAAEADTRDAGCGVWSLPQYRLIESIALDRNVRGFRRVQGRIVRVGHSDCCVWLNLEGDVALRIEREDLAHFPGRAFDRTEGGTAIARGWIYSHRGEIRIQIRHPAALEIIL